MTTQAIHLHDPWAHVHEAGSALARGFRYLAAHYLLMPAGAVIALVWANAWPESYFRLAHQLAFPVNEVAMVFFFGLIAQEVYEELMPGGTLHYWRRWTVPLVAAIGGVIGSAAVYGTWVSWRLVPVLHAGWPAAAAVDLAFAYFIVRFIFQRHPAVSFVLLLAVASNVIAAIAIAPTFLAIEPRAGGAAVLMAGAVGLAGWLRQQQVREFWPYLWIAGGLSWLALYIEGFHPALALVPIVPFMPHTPRWIDELLKDEDTGGDAPRHFEHVWHWHVQIALLLFGLVNGGVLLAGHGNGTWGTVLAAVGGRTLGIVAGAAAALAVGLHLPANLRWRELIVVALAVSTGFTFTVFFATAIFPVGPTLAELKLGGLLTGGGVLLAVAAAWLLRVGRFGRTAAPRTRAREA
jgi:NhaA family Na+:H+ antiporter